MSVLLKTLSSGHVPVGVGSNESGEVTALIPVLARYPVLGIFTSDAENECRTNAQKHCPNIWTISPATAAEQTDVATWMNNKGFKKLGIVEMEIDYTESETPLIEGAVAPYHMSHTVAAFPMSAVDLTPQMSELKASGAQVVYAEALGPAVGYILRARAQLGWNVPVVFDLAASSSNPASLAPPALYKGTYMNIFYDNDPEDPSAGIPAMLKYASPYGAVTSGPLNATADGWDEIVALDAAVTQAGGAVDVKSLDAAMLQVPPTNPLRNFSDTLGFTASDHDNDLNSPLNFEVVPVAPIVNGQIKEG